jgi:iron complex outermembrane receptor protein
MKNKVKNKRYQISLLPIMLILQAHSQSTEDQVPEEAVVQDAMVVVGDKVEWLEPSTDVILAGARDLITRDQLEYEHPDDTLELFTKLPGVNVARYNQGIINTDVGIRGFGTDGVTPHAKLLIDGIPSNIHNGYNELDQMFPLAIGAIDVFKGTSDLRYGMYNVAGSYNVYSRTDFTNEVQTTVDTFGAYETQAYSGTQVGKLAQHYFLGYRDGKGYRDHTDLEKYAISGLWAYSFDDHSRMTLSVRSSSYEGDSPGYLSKAAAAADPESSALYSSQDGGEKEVNQVSLQYDSDLLEGDVQLSLKAYHNDVYRNRFVRFSQAGNLRNRIDDQQISGFISSVNWDVNDDLSVIMGFDYQYQDILEQQFNAIVDATSPTGYLRKPGTVRRNFEYDLSNFGGFIGLEHQALNKFRWNTGLRLDTLDGDFRNRATGLKGEAHDFGKIVQPKLNVFYDFNEKTSAFANYGRTFQSPVGADFYKTGASNFDVNTYDGGEVGVAYMFADESNIRFSLWNQVADNEYQLDQLNGGFKEIGEVSRAGIEVSFDYKASDQMTWWANLGLTKSELKEDSAGFPGTKGNEVRGTPDLTYSLGVSYQLSEKLTARLTFDGQSDYFVNENNLGGQYGAYHILSAGFDYELKRGLLSLQINNLANEDFEYVYDLSSNGTNTIHSPGDGTNASLSYKLTF